MLDLLHVNSFWYDHPIQKVAFYVPFQWNTFGFMDDYTKVTYGMRDTLQLIRKGDDDSLFRTVAACVGKIVLSKLAWSVQGLFNQMM